MGLWQPMQSPEPKGCRSLCGSSWVDGGRSPCMGRPQPSSRQGPRRPFAFFPGGTSVATPRRCACLPCFPACLVCPALPRDIASAPWRGSQRSRRVGLEAWGLSEIGSGNTSCNAAGVVASGAQAIRISLGLPLTCRSGAARSPLRRRSIVAQAPLGRCCGAVGAALR